MISSEEFYLGSFISGLREEIRNTIELFNPSNLKDALKISRQIELSLGSYGSRKPPMAARTHTTIETLPYQEPVYKETSAIAKNLLNSANTLTIDQKRARGLCLKCGEKYHQGHKCTNRAIHALVAANGEGNGQEKLDQFEFNLDEDIEEEGATMTLGDPNGEGHHRTMKLEGSIGQFPIKAMLDSGSTHCFLNPSIAQQLNLPLTQTKPLIVRPTAIDYSPTLCVRILNLSSKAIISKPTWVRVLEVEGYDMILGIGLPALGPWE